MVRRFASESLLLLMAPMVQAGTCGPDAAGFESV